MVARISSRHNPLVARFKHAARGAEPGVVLLDGTHLVEDALAVGLPVLEVAAGIDAADHGTIAGLLDRLSRAGARVSIATAPVMAAISPVRSPSPIVALALRPTASATQLYAGPAPLVVIASGVQDPGNLGAIVRVAEAGGASGVVATDASADPYGWKALRGSMGSTLRLPVAVGPSARAAADEARRHGCRVVAAAPRGGVALFAADLAGPLALLIGSEGMGLPADAIEEADLRITIPMASPVESLNAAITAALIVYEVRRRRNG